MANNVLVFEVDTYHNKFAHFVGKSEDATELDFVEYSISIWNEKLKKVEVSMQNDFQGVKKTVETKSKRWVKFGPIESREEDFKVFVREKIEEEKNWAVDKKKKYQAILKFYQSKLEQLQPRESVEELKTFTAEKMRFLYTTGVIKHLKENVMNKLGASNDQLAKVISKITGDKVVTISRALSAIDNDEQGTDKNPLQNKKKMREVKEFFAENNMKTPS